MEVGEMDSISLPITQEQREWNRISVTIWLSPLISVVIWDMFREVFCVTIFQFHSLTRAKGPNSNHIIEPNSISPMVSVERVELCVRVGETNISSHTEQTRSIRMRQRTKFGKKLDETKPMSQPITNSQTGWDTIIVTNWVLTMMSRHHPLEVIQEAVSESPYISMLIRQE